MCNGGNMCDSLQVTNERRYVCACLLEPRQRTQQAPEECHQVAFERRLRICGIDLCQRNLDLGDIVALVSVHTEILGLYVLNACMLELTCFYVDVFSIVASKSVEQCCPCRLIA